MKTDSIADHAGDDSPAKSLMDSDHSEPSYSYFHNTANKPENLCNLFTAHKKVVISVTLFTFVVTSFVCMLAFFVRCDESTLISYSKSQNCSVERAYAEFSSTWQAHVKDEEEKYKSRKIEWVRVDQFDEETFQADGNERFNGGNVLLYVARTPYLNGTVVGKYCHYLRTMWFGYEGRTRSNRIFEILSYPKGTLSWVLKQKGEALPPENTFLYGGTAPVTGKNTYICRLKYDGHLVLGKFFADGTTCMACYDVIDRTNETFEILVINAMGRMLGVDS